MIDGEPLMLRAPVRYDSGFVMVPLQFLIEVASHYTPRSFDWNAATMTLRVQGLGYNIQDIKYSTAANRSTATITLSEHLYYHMDTNTPGLVRL